MMINEKRSFCLGLFMLLCEFVKQFLLTFSINAGHYDWWYFPFQLCSIPMYLLILFPFVSASLQEIFLSFFASYTLLGGIAVFFDTSGMHYPLPILTFHSYAWHILLIFLGLYSGMVLIRKKIHRVKWIFLKITILYGFLCLTASLLNWCISPIGTINMFYINPRFRMEQLFFRTLAKRYGNTAGIWYYILATVLGAFLFIFLWKQLSLKRDTSAPD